MSAEKTKRNQRILKLSKKGGGTMTYREIAKKFKLKSVKSVYTSIKSQLSK